MISTHVKPTLITLGLAIGCVGAFSSVSAEESILHDAIDDYSGETRGSFADQSPSMRLGGYRTETILEVAYHDYSGAEAMAYNADLVTLEEAEFAASEVGGATLTSPTIIPWDLKPLD